MEIENNKNESVTIENELAAIIPNNKQVMLNKTMMLDILGFQTKVNKATVFLGLTSKNLSSIGQYCNSDCSTHFQ